MKLAIIISASVLGALFILFCIYLFLIKTSGRRSEMEKYKSIYYAHRGLHGGGAAENSMTAFRRAVDSGFGIELDVRLSKDGELMVFHDDTLDRVCGVEGRVDAFSAEELGKIKLSGTDDTVPRFKDVLGLIDGKVPLLIEIKEDAGKYGVTDALIRLLPEYRGEYIIESFNPLALGRVKRDMPGALRGFLCENFLREKKYRKPMYFLLQTLTLNSVCRPDFIAFKHSDYKNASLKLTRGIYSVPTLAWTVRSQAEENAAKAHGFDGIIFENYIPKR